MRTRALIFVACAACTVPAERASAPSGAHGVERLAPRALPRPPPPPACVVPSLERLRELDDGRDLAVLDQCEGASAWKRASNEEQALATRCGHTEPMRPVDVARLEEAIVLPDAAVARAREIRAIGAKKGRRVDVLGLVGDSMTIDHSFMRPFGALTPDRVSFLPEIRERLVLQDGKTIIHFFRKSYDSFTTIRAARIGATARWAVGREGGPATAPLQVIINNLSPAWAVILYGTNDAQHYLLPDERAIDEFDKYLRVIVDQLEAAGVVPILTTPPKHMRDRRLPDCPTNLRYAILTSSASARVAALACERHLPLVDLRWALEPLLNHGIGGDGVHMSLHMLGGGLLDTEGLQCGFNVRNYVTLRMLTRLVDTVK